MRTKPVLAAGAAILSLVAAACGGGSSSSANVTTTTGTTSTPGSTTAARPATTQRALPQTESSPPGDIPDDQAFVRVAAPGYSVEVPEGWARTASGGALVFTDKLNTVRLGSRRRHGSLTPASVKAVDVPGISASATRFRLGGVAPVTRTAGTGVLVTYTADAPPDPVTGKVYTDAVERYLFAHGGRVAVLTLSGPEGADNVDPWRRITDSLTWRR